MSKRPDDASKLKVLFFMNQNGWIVSFYWKISCWVILELRFCSMEDSLGKLKDLRSAGVDRVDRLVCRVKIDLHRRRKTWSFEKGNLFLFRTFVDLHRRRKTWSFKKGNLFLFRTFVEDIRTSLLGKSCRTSPLKYVVVEHFPSRLISFVVPFLYLRTFRPSLNVCSTWKTLLRV